MFQHLKRLLGHSLIYGLGSALGQAMSLLILPLFTAYLTPTDYGINSVLSLLSSFLSGFLTLGVGSALSILYHEQTDPKYRQQVIFTGFILLLPACLLLLGVIPFAPWISALLLGTPEYGNIVVQVLLSSICMILTTPLWIVLQLQERSKAVAFSSLASTFISLGGSTLLIVWLKWGIFGRFVGYTLGTVSQLMMILVFLRSQLRPPWDLKQVPLLLRYGLPSMPNFFLNFIVQQGNVYILKTFSSLAAVGLYSIGMTFGSALSLLVSSFISAWSPFAWTFKGNIAEARQLFGKIFSYYLLSVGLVSLGLYLFAKPLILLFTHRTQYFEAYRLVGLGSTQQLLLGAYLIVSVEAVLAKHIKIGVVIQAISTLIFVLTSLVLTQHFQSEGAACALIVSQLSSIGMIVVWNRRHRDHPDYIQINYETPRILKFTLVYLSVVSLTLIEPHDFSWAQLAVNIGISLGLITFFWQRWISASEKQEFRRLLERSLRKLSPPSAQN